MHDRRTWLDILPAIHRIIAQQRQADSSASLAPTHGIVALLQKGQQYRRLIPGMGRRKLDRHVQEIITVFTQTSNTLYLANN